MATAGERAFVVRTVFEDVYQDMKSGTLLRQVINKINEEIDFNDSKNRHLLGEMYEQILRDLQSAGNAGEYYTPRAVTQFMVEMVDPQLGETVLDPACATGGFLTCTIEHIRRHYVKTPEDERTLQACRPAWMMQAYFRASSNRADTRAGRAGTGSGIPAAGVIDLERF